MKGKKAFDSLRPDDCLGVITEGLNALEEHERRGRQAPDLWRTVRSIVGGIVPAVHWKTLLPPTQVGPQISLLGPITTRDPQWAASNLNLLMRTARVLPAVEVTAQGTPKPFIYRADEQARVAWALWWCFQSDELKRLRRCEACGRWFRDKTKPLNMRRCSMRCTKRITMRAYRAALKKVAGRKRRRAKRRV